MRQCEPTFTCSAWFKPAHKQVIRRKNILEERVNPKASEPRLLILTVHRVVIKCRRLTSEWDTVNLDLGICERAKARNLMRRVHVHHDLITLGNRRSAVTGLKKVASENREVTSHFYDRSALLTLTHVMSLNTSSSSCCCCSSNFFFFLRGCDVIWVLLPDTAGCGDM